MTEFEQYEQMILQGLKSLEIVIVDEDKNIIKFLNSIKKFQAKSHFNNGAEVIAFLSQISGHDSGFGFAYNNVFYLIYRFGKTGDSGYYMFVSKNHNTLAQYFIDKNYDALDPDIVQTYIDWLKTPLNDFPISMN